MHFSYKKNYQHCRVLQNQIRLKRFIGILTTRENMGTELKVPDPGHDRVLKFFGSAKVIVR